MRALCIIAVVFLVALLAPLPGMSLVEAQNLSDGSLYSDQVARRTGDLITIMISDTRNNGPNRL